MLAVRSSVAMRLFVLVRGDPVRQILGRWPNESPEATEPLWGFSCPEDRSLKPSQKETACLKLWATEKIAVPQKRYLRPWEGELIRKTRRSQGAEMTSKNERTRSHAGHVANSTNRYTQPDALAKFGEHAEIAQSTGSEFKAENEERSQRERSRFFLLLGGSGLNPCSPQPSPALAAEASAEAKSNPQPKAQDE